MNIAVPVVTIDGPGGSGKGTIAQRVAQQQGWHLLDSGALYRLLGLAAQIHGLDLANETGLTMLAKHLDIEFVAGDSGEPQVILEGDEVTRQIRSEACGAIASQIAVLPAVRAGLLARQHAFRIPPGLVADGRDMGSVVFPDALLKVFLTAAPEARAERRYKQLMEKGMDANLVALLRDITERDARDASRSVAPLKPAADAIVLDSTNMSIDAVVQFVLEALAQRHAVT